MPRYTGGILTQIKEELDQAANKPEEKQEPQHEDVQATEPKSQKLKKRKGDQDA